MAAPKKQPAIPMMIGDYLKDPRLSQASLFSRGTWAILLMFMWEWDRRGEIETTLRGLDRLLKPDSIEEILFFLNEMHDLEFGGIFATDPEKDLVFPLTLENCNGKVTIRNRKMYADYKNRQNTRLRVEKCRKKKTETPVKQKRNTDVTPSLSVSVSITKKYNKEFLAFYEKYPLKKGKENALKSYTKLKPDIAVILKAIDLQTYEKKTLIDAGEFCPDWPHPATWLNQKRWEDEIKTPKEKQTTQAPKEFELEMPDNMLTPAEMAANIVKFKEKIGGIG